MIWIYESDKANDEQEMQSNEFFIFQFLLHISSFSSQLQEPT